MTNSTSTDIGSVPIEEVDVSRPELFLNDTWQPWFARLRDEAPVHYLADSANGAFWSVSSHEHIKEVDSNHHPFTSSSCLDQTLVQSTDWLSICPICISS